jgi:hypothetical protein
MQDCFQPADPWRQFVDRAVTVGAAVVGRAKYVSLHIQYHAAKWFTSVTSVGVECIEDSRGVIVTRLQFVN